MKTIESCPDLGIAESILLKHFLNGLGLESAFFLDSFPDDLSLISPVRTF
jgi:hypothetical protein